MNMYTLTKTAALKAIDASECPDRLLRLWIETDQCETALDIIKTVESYGITIEG